jgi:superfamily II DNA or RNA helicase
MSNIEDFLSKYPDSIPFSEAILNPYGNENFYEVIYRKKEFYEKRLDKFESKPILPGQLLKHQEIVSRFLSSDTLYDSLLLFHEMGTGKTGVSVALAELIKNKEGTINKALILMRGKALIDNYINELVFVNTEGQYIPENYEKLSPMEKIVRTKKKISEFYEFDTFEVFAKNITKMSPSKIAEMYSNRVVIIDEVHNIRPQDKETAGIYESIHRFLHTIKNSKILLMTATPMKDKPEEIADILNLILPENRQLPTGDNFVKEFLSQQENNIYQVNPDKKDVLESYFRGKISYLKSQQSDVEKKFMGEKFKKLQKFVIYPLEMSGYQRESYLESYSKDTEGGPEGGIYSNSRQASLFIYPDGSYGQKGFSKYIIEKKSKSKEGKVSSTFTMTEEFRRAILGETNLETLENIRKHSVKYYTTLKNIIENPKRNAFVYCDFVEGSGAILFSKLLELLNYRKSTGNETTKDDRYAIITHKTASTKQIRNILSKFNSNENIFGDYIRVIIGSRVIGEGFSLKSIGDIHILTPHWNYSETDQAIARGLRLFSHVYLQDAGITPIVRIFQYTALPSLSEYKKSIDYIMYLLSETKDVSIKSVERIIKESAFDCALNYTRNFTPGNDFTRICDYLKCEYKCNFQPPVTEVSLDYTSYNLFYSRNEIRDITVQLKKLFLSKNIYFLEEIKNEMDMHNTFLILSTLDYLINEKIPFINKHNQLCYLKHYSDLFYLDISTNYIENMTEWLYIDTPAFFEMNSVQSITSKYEKENIPVLIRQLEESETDEEYETVFKRFSQSIQEMFIEASVLNKYSGISQGMNIRDWVLKKYENYLFKIENTWVSTFLKEQGVMRCLPQGGQWEDCDEDIQEIIANKLKEKVEDISKTDYGYYGIYNEKDDKFYIRDVSSMEEDDKRKQSRGRLCVTWDKKDLIHVAHTVKLDYTGDNSKFIGLLNKLNKLSKENLLKIKDKYKNAEEVEKLTKSEIVRIYFWSTVKKELICTYLKKWFKDNQLEIVI